MMMGLVVRLNMKTSKTLNQKRKNYA